MADFMTATEAARRLGIKPATLYAYVSRGVLSRDKAADGRASLFDPDRGRAAGPTGTAAAACRGRGHHHRVGHHRDYRRHPPLPRPRRDQPRGPPHLRRRRRTALDRRVPRPGQGAGGRQGTVAGEARGAGRGPGRAGCAASRDAAARAAPGYRAGDGRDRSAPAPTRPIGRARGWTEHHRGHGGLPAPARHFDNFGHIRINNPNGNFRLGRSGVGRSRNASGRSSATSGPALRCFARCPRRWYCSPTTSLPRPRWPSGPRPRCGPIRTPWSGPAWVR